MSTSLRTLKGVGEKTEKLFAKIGVTDMESLLSYYPRNYDAYEEPVEIQSLEEGAVVAISVAVITGVYVNQVRNLQVITTTVADLTGKISVTWFNAPYLRSAVRKGSRFVLRGRVVRKQGKLQMEHPEIFTPAAYEEILHSLQPIYGLTAGLSNKTIVKLIHQVLDEQKLQAEYLADEYKERYHLADRNFAIPAIHFPKNMQELLAARRRLVFDEFLLFILAVQSLKEKTEEAPKAIIDKVKDGKMVELSTDAFAGMDIKRRDIRTFKKDETTKDESIFEVGSVIAFKTPHKGDKIGIMRILSIGVDFTQDSAWNNENATITFDLYYQK